MFNQTQPAAMPTVFQQAKARASEMINLGQRELAIPLLRDLLKQQPRDPQLLHMLGVSLHGNDSMAAKSKEPENLRLLRFAANLAPNNAEILVDYASACQSLGMLREAHKMADKARSVNPAHARAVQFKARLLQGVNKVPEALELLEAQMRDHPDPLLVVSYGDMCLHQGLCEQAVDALKPLFDDVTCPKPRRIEAAFLLGHLHDKLKEYDTAFEYFRIGNTMQGPEPASKFDEHLEKWSRERLDSIPAARKDGSKAIMVVGMPRSGTTLTEIILASHPKISGVGESTLLNRLVHRNPVESLTDQALIDSYGKEYLEMLERCSPEPNMARVVDKMPENYIYCGLAAKILPGMSLIHSKRDARDTCLSIYFQQFGPWIQYAKSLESLGDQYLGYLRTMKHYRDECGVRMFESEYESLTADPEPNIRAMLDHVGMPFHEACLSPHKSKKSVNTASIAQVRRPIYKSSGQRWKNYEKHLGPLLERLEGV
jgi:tetratricopeptide (TPR) repeat protein|tara:strand:+ start:3445 stop:4902 length:1458 start_codon:yes stop_codon:yes gene_type:complete